MPGSPGSKIDRKPVYGTIAGAEGRSGVVTFIPTNTSIGPAATRSFQNGAYRFNKSNGPVPGDYSVSIKLELPSSEPTPA